MGEKEKAEKATPEQWKELYKHFANPNCNKCYGTGNIGNQVNPRTGEKKLLPCTRKGCTAWNMKLYQLREKQKKQAEMRKKLEEKDESD
jgi:hypothetical protein